MSGAPAATLKVDVTAASATAVTGLTVSDVTVGASQPVGWITATLSAQTAPATLIISVNPTALVAARYEANIRLAATGAEAKTVRVSVTVQPRPTLVLDRTAIVIASDVGTSIASQSVAVSGHDGSVDSLAVSKPDCGPSPPWLAATLNASTTPATVSVAISPTGLGAGTHSCSFTVSTAQKLIDSASQVVKVSLTLKAVAKIAVSTDTVKMSVTRTSDAAPVRVSITNAGAGALTGLSLGSIAYSTGGANWLTASLDSTTAPATLSLLASAKTLAVGAYSATVPVTSAATGVGNNPAAVTVSIQVIPLPSSLVAIPNHFTLTTKQGVLGYWHLTLTVTHSGDDPIAGVAYAPFTPPPGVTVTTAVGCTGAAWLTPCNSYMDVTAPASLAPGTYSGSVIYWAYPSGQTAAVGITVTVTP